jgi:uncharacterized damage-inducible protein DinB
VTPPFPAPTAAASDRSEVFLRYLDYFRETVVAKTAALPESERRAGHLPSGWTPLELLKHLRYMERRWIEWGFAGQPLADPWGDERDGRWHVEQSETVASLTAELRAQGVRTREVVGSADLSAVGAPGPRWEGAPPATLERVLFHVFQEYARHLGQLDIVVELSGGPTGE